MKKIIFIVSILIPSITFSQYKYYNAASFTQPYNYLSGSISVNNAQYWDAADFNIPIGFLFHFFNDTTTKLYLTPEGGSDAVVNIHPVDFSTPFNSCIIAHGSDLKDKGISGVFSKSPISYSLTGVSPSRIFKLEWRNAGFSFGATTDSLNLQLWLYETSDVIEIHIGEGNYTSPPSDIYANSAGPWIGLADSIDRNASTVSARKFYQFAGPASSPILDSSTTINTSAPLGLAGSPVSGSVYQFSPKLGPDGIDGYASNYSRVTHEVNYFSNSNELRIDLFSNDKYTYQIINLQGAIVTQGNLTKGRKIINANNFASGLYMVQLHSSSENISYKFLR